MRRIRLALWIAVIEGIIVAFLHDVSRWTVIAVSIPLLALYLFWGRDARSDTARQVTWIAGASQALAVVVVIFSFLLSWLALVLRGNLRGDRRPVPALRPGLVWTCDWGVAKW